MIDVRTKILGLIGYPLGHSLSPLLHNHSLMENGLNYVYLSFPIEPDNLEKGLEGLKALKFRGVNVTIPYKERVIPFLDEFDQVAEEAGAVNTIVNNEGILTGYNTDITGFIRMLEDDGKFKIKGKRAVIIGAGGAAKAVGIGLLSRRIKEIYLLNRTLGRAENLISVWKQKYPQIKIVSGELIPEIYIPMLKKADLLVDTTPVGMEPDVEAEPVIMPEVLHSNLLVVDLVYNPAETTLLKAGKKAGARTLNGLGMLLYQGSESFKLWTGIEPDLDSWRKMLK